MPLARNEGTPAGDRKAEPSDEFLVSSMLGGDAAALRTLIHRYDRLVRYTIFRASRTRCRHDPHWIETIASDTWTGFVQSLRRTPDNPPASLTAYLSRIARNRSISALRSHEPQHQSLDDSESQLGIAAETEEPLDSLSRIEALEALSTCIDELGEDARLLAAQLTAITERRWTDAAAALGLSESTLRSRWKRVVAALRTCVDRKTGRTLAPRLGESDL